jgi:D-glycero-alpha-D-manno-heptose-7-phosphate kinase
MIISRTPLRLSFFGGGSDLKDFYEKEGGAVLSTAIDKYIFATVNKKFDDHIRISYSKTEIVETVDQVQHELVREAMKLTGVTKGIEITTISDIPSHGTGLGSSSTFTVGILNALHEYNGKRVPAEQLAKEACQIEIDIVKEPIGKQDQFIAAYGGLQFIQFNKDGSVKVEQIAISSDMKKDLNDNLMLFYTGMTRKANTILTEQKANSSEKKLSELKLLKALAFEGKKAIESDRTTMEFGRLLDEGWKIKKSLAKGVSNNEIDQMYDAARSAGALGGKVAGAGGGGFLLLYVPKTGQESVRRALSGLKEVKFKFEPLGSKIVYVSDQGG